MTMNPLTKAFRELEKQGYFASRKIADCRTCGWAIVPDKYECLAVFTVDYDEADYKKTGSCYLNWSAPEDNPNEIIKELKKAGLKVKWDKSPRTRLLITNKNYGKATT